MNHAQIAAEALRFRISTIRRPLVDDRAFDVEAIAASTVTACEPEVDSALRRIATAWTRAGLEPAALCRPWRDPVIEELFAHRPDLVDALDDIVRVATRISMAA